MPALPGARGACVNLVQNNYLLLIKNGWMDGMDGWVDGSVDGWMDGLVDGWKSGWMDGWMESRLTHASAFVFMHLPAIVHPARLIVFCQGCHVRNHNR